MKNRSFAFDTPYLDEKHDILISIISSGRVNDKHLDQIQIYSLVDGYR